jgi:hypothetical protein
MGADVVVNRHCDTWNTIAATYPKCFSAIYNHNPTDGVNNYVLRPRAAG